jgi:hypothetical protein
VNIADYIHTYNPIVPTYQNQRQNLKSDKPFQRLNRTVVINLAKKKTPCPFPPRPTIHSLSICIPTHHPEPEPANPNSQNRSIKRLRRNRKPNVMKQQKAPKIAQNTSEKSEKTPSCRHTYTASLSLTHTRSRSSCVRPRSNLTLTGWRPKASHASP